jgi:thiamine phosphate synthase YjbQ (UPF0047 family)
MVFRYSYRQKDENTLEKKVIGMTISGVIGKGSVNLVLGTWQSLFFCEFDGPRTRKVLVRLTAG